MTDRPVGGGITARNLVQARREIGCFLDPGLFSDPAYDILLTLLAAEDGDKPFNLSDSVQSASVPATTALRWISLLEARGLVTRTLHPDDDCRTTLALTPECRMALHAYLEQASLTLT